MSVPLKAGAVTVTHANSDKDNQIFIAAEAIWGIKSDKLPQEKFDELKTVLVGNLTRQYGPYTVESKPLGSGNVFMIYMDPKVLKTSYQKSPCSLGTCMVTNAAFKCVRCQEAMYCSKEHQIQDWSRHKVECISKK
ncbi:zinc finger MYND domain-containing protein [bacterium]|nr:zinc finger MYND domain-containing protein [bacterium]